MLDPQAQAYLDELRGLGPPSYPELGVAEARRLVEASASDLFGEPAHVAPVEGASADGVPVRLYGAAAGGPALVYFHGGGWVVGSLDSHDALCRAIAAESGCAVVSVDYRLAPEHPYPAAVEDAWTATAWAAARFPRVAVGGDSAGGHLAAVTALRARDRGVALALQALLYPATDAAADSDSYRRHAEVPNFRAETMRWFWSLFLPDASRRAEPEASPLRAPSLAGVAPAFVLVAEYDLLHDEGVAYAEALAAAGVPTELRRYEGMVHNFLRLPALLDRARAGIADVALAVRTALHGH